ncbi:polyphosphate polymerase domain-containing protein [Bacteroidota bacterium]
MERMKLLADSIALFDPVSLEEMDHVKLMRRRDTKFVLPVDLLPEILKEIRAEYRALEINGIRIQEYHSLYFDTSELEMYRMHHNGRLNRHKVRVRTYSSNNKTFLEVKLKNNRQETIKTRIPVSKDSLEEEESAGFLKKNAPYRSEDLIPALRNSFNRITLVNKSLPERITIDTELTYNTVDNSRTMTLHNLAVIEVKRDRDAAQSNILYILNRHKIHPIGFSKYCMGTVITNRQVKHNLFKNRLRRLGKIDNTFFSLN